MNNQDLVVMIMNPTIQVAMIVGIVEVLKRVGFNKKALPIIDVVLGLVFGIVVYGYLQELGTIQGVLIGLALGLSACGLFSGIKNIAQHETYTFEEVADELDIDTEEQDETDSEEEEADA